MANGDYDLARRHDLTEKLIRREDRLLFDSDPSGRELDLLERLRLGGPVWLIGHIATARLTPL